MFSALKGFGFDGGHFGISERVDVTDLFDFFMEFIEDGMAEVGDVSGEV